MRYVAFASYQVLCKLDYKPETITGHMTVPVEAGASTTDVIARVENEIAEAYNTSRVVLISFNILPEIVGEQ